MDKNKMAVDIFNEHAVRYQEKYMDVQLYASSFNQFCEAVKQKNARVLELACGPGNITKYLLEKRPDFEIFGIDLSEKMIDLARINNPSARFEVMDCRKISALNTQYDAIMCGFCLPYLSKSEALKLIEDAAKLLKKEGVIYISTMEDDYHKSGFKDPNEGVKDRMYTYYHEGSYLVECLKHQNFSKIETRRQQFPVESGDPVTDLLLIAQK